MSGGARDEVDPERVRRDLPVAAAPTSPAEAQPVNQPAQVHLLRQRCPDRILGHAEGEVRIQHTLQPGAEQLRGLAAEERVMFAAAR